MGEAKRRQKWAAGWHVLFPAGAPAISLKVVAVDLSSPPEHALNALQEMVGSLPSVMRAIERGRKVGAAGFLWHQAPTGREWIEEVAPGSWNEALKAASEWAAARSWDLMAVEVHGTGATPWSSDEQGAARRLATPSPAKQRVTVTKHPDLWKQPSEQWNVPRAVVLDSSQHQALEREILGRMERAIASKERWNEHLGRVSLIIDGLQGDSREVWEIEQARELVQRIAAWAPWWPWLIHRTQAFMWLACLIPSKRTVRLQDGEVLMDWEADALEEQVATSVAAALRLAEDLGVTKEEMQAAAMGVLAPLMRFVEHHAAQWARFEAGELHPAQGPTRIGPSTMRAKFEGASTPAPDGLPPSASVDAAVASSMGSDEALGVMLDRSPAALVAIDHLARCTSWHAAVAKTPAVQAWLAGGDRFLALWGHSGGSIVARQSDNLVDLCGSSLGSCLSRAKAKGVTTAWAVVMEPVAAAAVRDEITNFTEIVGA